MFHIVTDSNFEQEVLKEKKVVLVDFWAEWCAPCRRLLPVIEEIANEMSDKVKVCKLNVDENSDIAARYKIRSLPTLILFKDSAVFATQMGSLPKGEIVKWIEAHL